MAHPRPSSWGGRSPTAILIVALVLFGTDLVASALGWPAAASVSWTAGTLP